jgi:hypothetical protein
MAGSLIGEKKKEKQAQLLATMADIRIYCVAFLGLGWAGLGFDGR